MPSGRRAAEVVAAMATSTRNRDEQWHRIGDFLAVWDRPLRKADGCSLLEVEGAQERLGLPLPASLAELYLLLGHRTEMLSHQNHHLLPIVRLETAGDMLRFACEWQANWWWGIRLDDIGAVDDPAVYVDNLLTKETASGRADGEVLYPTGLSVSEYALAVVVLETGIYGKAGFYAGEQPAPLLDLGFQEVPLPSFNLMGYDDGSPEDAGDHLFLHELGVAYDSPGGISVAARRPKDQAALERLVPRGEW